MHYLHLIPQIVRFILKSPLTASSAQVWYDDILVFGEGSSEDEELVDHDQNLRSLMQRCGEQNMKLNKDKVKLWCEEVPFLDQLILKDGL